jgi:hypothetical protein
VIGKIFPFRQLADYGLPAKLACLVGLAHLWKSEQLKNNLLLVADVSG